MISWNIEIPGDSFSLGWILSYIIEVVNIVLSGVYPDFPRANESLESALLKIRKYNEK